MGLRILVVDDSTATRAFIRGALRGAGADFANLELVEAKGGFEALRLLPHGPFDAVISDINMPDLSGLELLSFIRSNGRHSASRVLLISTRNIAAERARGLRDGADAFLAKPFTAHQLQRSVAQMLEHRDCG